MFLTGAPSRARIEQFISAQKDQPFSYDEVGATQGDLPPGYSHDHHRIKLGEGRQIFQGAVAALRSWKQFDLGWVRVVPKGQPLQTGVTVAVRAHTLSLWSLNAARIVYVVNEAKETMRFGFAYGTLPDHVERGEERFLIEWMHEDDSVWYDLLAFSRPRHPLARLGYPITRAFQRRFARDSMRRMAAEIK